MIIYFDSIQEGQWFQNLHPKLATAALAPFPSTKNLPEYLKGVLELDRPDIVLVDNDRPILVVERTIEVPSGHNVGQRFARLVAAARYKVPVVYFGPYAAYKHGGVTQGPRYMNLRLFGALAALAKIEQAAVTTMRWPVDQDFEIIQTPEKDQRIKDYLKLFFELYESLDFSQICPAIMQSKLEKDFESERDKFILDHVKSPKQYDGPPDSVKIVLTEELVPVTGALPASFCKETVVYDVGMKYIRSDPYTGMSLLYSYLYCGGLQNRTRNLMLKFPHISMELWHSTADGRPRKDIRLFKLAADAIIFSNGFLLKETL